MATFKILISLILISASCKVLATTAEDVKQKSKDAASAAANYTVEQKEMAQKEMEKSLTSLKKQIVELKAEASKKTDSANAQARQQIAQLEKKQKELSTKMEKLKKSSGKAWDDMKAGMSEAIKKLSDAYDKAKEDFK
jgi:hypothetical protein